MVSTDDLAAARKPYGYVTRMLRIVGCKRIETNDLRSFKNISEANLNSIFRSNLARIPQAVFVGGEYLEKEYSDVSKDGIFPKYPTLRAFLEAAQPSQLPYTASWSLNSRGLERIVDDSSRHMLRQRRLSTRTLQLRQHTPGSVRASSSNRV